IGKERGVEHLGVAARDGQDDAVHTRRGDAIGELGEDVPAVEGAVHPIIVAADIDPLRVDRVERKVGTGAGEARAPGGAAGGAAGIAAGAGDVDDLRVGGIDSDAADVAADLGGGADAGPVHARIGGAEEAVAAAAGDVLAGAQVDGVVVGGVDGD